jgi:ribosomal protein S18 acetylase RimI-like enzyme
MAADSTGLEVLPLGTCDSQDLAEFIDSQGGTCPGEWERRPGVLPTASDVKRAAAAERAWAVAAVIDGSVEGFAVLQYPRWDREHFGFTVARIPYLEGATCAARTQLVDAAVKELWGSGARMCSARLRAGALLTLGALEDAGFRFVELMLSPWRSLNDWTPKGHSVTRPTTRGDVDCIASIARASFSTDRFHRDTHFSRGAADGVYEKWVRSWFADDSLLKRSLTLVVDGTVAGFILFELPASSTGDSTVRIVLNAVAPEYRSGGYGFRMYSDALDEASQHADYVTASVAAANPTALNLYSRLGFALGGCGDVTLHWWAEDTRGTSCEFS